MTDNHASLSATVVCTALAVVGGCSADDDDRGVEVSRTQYGVVHVKAEDYRGLGYGFGFAHAHDNICLVAEYLVTVNGERSRYFGIEGDEANNPSSDFFARYYFDEETLHTTYSRMSQTARDLVDGYVSGYNRYLDLTGTTGLPEACRDAPWVRPMGVIDVYRMFEDKHSRGSGGRFSDAIVAAAPPGQAERSDAITRDAHVETDDDIPMLGSNGWAFGRDATVNGRGVLVGNPHYPWQGENRFYQIHLTIPGKYDVMGATIAPIPLVAIGFNKDVAWTHTVSTGRRFTLFELRLDEQEPRAYIVDGERHIMKQAPVSIEVRLPDGAIETRQHVFYETIHGPVLAMPESGLGWSTSNAYALGDVNRLNADVMDTWLAMGKSQTVGEIKDALSARMALPWINTIAADRNGDVLYADYSRVPNVSADLLERCAPSPPAKALGESGRIFVLDGEDSSCNWHSGSKLPGGSMMAAEDMPGIIRTDYVANSNDSYWLVNGNYRFAEKSPIVGRFEVPQNLRTRKGILQITDRLAGKDGLPGDKVSPDTALAMQFMNSNYAAQLVLDDFLPICENEDNLALACGVLAAWDRRDNIDSRGAVLFRELWSRIEGIDTLFAVPFDPDDAVDTPHQLNIGNADVRAALLDALEEAVNVIDANGFAIDAPLGDVQVFLDDGRRIPIHGGPGAAGVLNVINTLPLSKEGYVPEHGSSYIQIVTFDDDGPVADGILSYAQSVDSASPYYADQTELYSHKQLYRLPFNQSDIRSDPGYRRIEIPDAVQSGVP